LTFLKKSTFLLLFGSAVYAQTMQELIDYAKMHATIIQNAKLNTQLAELKKKESKSSQYGELDIVGSATMYNLSKTIIPLTPAIIQSGTHVVTSKEIYSAGASYTLPLFTGFAQKEELEISQMAHQMAQIRTKLTNEELVYNIRSLYISILALEDTYKAQEAYIEALDKLSKQIQEEVTLGKKAKVDALKAKADCEAARLQGASIQNNIALAKSALAALVTKEITHLAPLPLDMQKEQETLNEMLLNLQNLKKVEVQNLAVEKAKKAIKKSESQNWPQLQLAAYAGKNFAQDKVTTAFNNETLWQVGINLKWNILDFGRTTAAIEGAKVSKLKEDVAKKETLLQLKKSLTDAYNTLHLHLKEYNLNKAQYALAQESAHIEMIRYNNNAATLNDLLLAKAKAQLALSGVIASKYNYQKSKYYIQYLMERGDKSE
jgi:outer membrane protein TolC